MHRGRRAAADLDPYDSCRRALHADFGGGGAAEIGRFHESGLHRLQIVGMHQRRRRVADQLLRRAIQQRLRRGAREADAAVGAVARDQVHRVVGEEAVHRGALRGGFVGGALAILRGGRDQGGLHHRGENRDRIDLPCRNRQARERKHVRGPERSATAASASAAAAAARSTAGRPPANAASAGTSASHTISGDATPPVRAPEISDQSGEHGETRLSPARRERDRGVSQ